MNRKRLDGAWPRGQDGDGVAQRVHILRGYLTLLFADIL